MTCARNITLVLLITVLVAGGPAHACTPPERPFLPTSREDMRAYACEQACNFDPVAG